MKFSRIVLDGDIWLWRAVSVSTSSTTFGDESILVMNQQHAESWLKEEFAKLRQRLGAKQIIVALGDRKRNFRKELCPTYKAHRPTVRPPGFEELEIRIRRACKVASEPRLEGDDLLGLLMSHPKTGDGAVAVSIDKDCRQIPGWHYNPDKDTLDEISTAAAEHLHLTQTLTGDRVDGYPGLPGCGPVSAAKILAITSAHSPDAWSEAIVPAFKKKGLTEADALLQARLAFILRQGYYDRKTKEVTLWTPE